MMQLYFLSIFLNLAIGYIFVFENEKGVVEIQLGFPVKDETIRLVLGILSMATGILKLLSPIRNILILGDFVPAVTGAASGLILIVEHHKSRNAAAQESDAKPSVYELLLQNKKIIGFAAIAAGILHFLFPSILFL